MGIESAVIAAGELDDAGRAALGAETVDLARRTVARPTAGYAQLGVDRTPEEGPRLVANLDHPGGRLVTLRSDGRLVAVAAVRPDPSLSSHFGVEMAGLSSVLVEDGAAHVDLWDRLVHEVVTSLAGSGGLLTARVQAMDVGAIGRLQSRGFMVCDAQITHLIYPDPDQVRDPPLSATDDPDGYERITDMPAAQREALAPVRDALVANYTLSQFHADPRLDDRLASEWYGVWADRAFAGDWADGIVLSRLGADTNGFITWKQDRLAEEVSGLKVVGSGLAASTGWGRFSSMVSTVARRMIFDFAEFDLHLANHPVNQVLVRPRTSRILRTSMAMHLWLDEFRPRS